MRDASANPMVLREYPITEGDSVIGYIDLISRRAYEYLDDAESTEIDFPDARAETLGFDPKAEATVQVFKTYHAQHSGKVSLGRVWSGEIKYSQNVGGQRIGGIQKIVGANAEKLNSACAGDIRPACRPGCGPAGGNPRRLGALGPLPIFLNYYAGV